VAQEGQLVQVRVTDTGPGIAPETIEGVFEPFWQGPRRLWRDKGGSGLGLSISRQFVKLHGGQMWLESELGARPGERYTYYSPFTPLTCWSKNWMECCIAVPKLFEML
jgi:signal transduction histidine kinase